MSEFFFLKKLRTIKPATFSKRDFSTDVLLRIFAKLLKALFKTPPVSASNFNSTLLTLRPGKTYI